MLPFGPPLAPMLGLLSETLPDGPGWSYEPKWDGFRVVVFRDGASLDLRSRDDRPLLRYFPELGPALLEALPERAVVDGEIVIARNGVLDFESLQLRLHPAASRVNKLAGTLPASVVVWDLLAEGDVDLRPMPFADRRDRLLARVRPNATVRITPSTTDRAVASDWYHRFEGAGFDGVMAKPLGDAYQPGKRAMVKVKHVRTIDAAVVGFRWHKHGEGTDVGSLVLGLFDDTGRLMPIGVASSFSKPERRRLVELLGPLRADVADHPWATFGPGADGEPTEGAERRPDMKSRWNAGRDLAWVPLRLEKVVEVVTTQHSSRRLRHPAKVKRWRDDKSPRDCTVDQLRVVAAPELEVLFPAATGAV
ncbi:MAG: ATP-dependent DNA ligase [Myxococcota bacterium]